MSGGCSDTQADGNPTKAAVVSVVLGFLWRALKNDFRRRALQDCERSDHMYVVSRCCMQDGDHRRIRIVFFPAPDAGMSQHLLSEEDLAFCLPSRSCRDLGCLTVEIQESARLRPVLLLMLRQLFRSKKEVKDVSIFLYDVLVVDFVCLRRAVSLVFVCLLICLMYNHYQVACIWDMNYIPLGQAFSPFPFVPRLYSLLCFNFSYPVELFLSFIFLSHIVFYSNS